MITVKFFGLISVENNVRQLYAKAGKVYQVLNEIRQQCPNISEEQLKKAILVINNELVTNNKRFSIILKDGDELVLITPASGG